MKLPSSSSVLFVTYLGGQPHAMQSVEVHLLVQLHICMHPYRGVDDKQIEGQIGISMLAFKNKALLASSSLNKRI